MPLPPWEMAKGKGIRAWLREQYLRAVETVTPFASCAVASTKDFVRWTTDSIRALPDDSLSEQFRLVWHAGFRYDCFPFTSTCSFQTDQMRFVSTPVSTSSGPDPNSSQSPLDSFWHSYVDFGSGAEEQRTPSWTQPFPASPPFNRIPRHNHTFGTFEASAYPTEMPKLLTDTFPHPDLYLTESLPESHLLIPPTIFLVIIAIFYALGLYLVEAPCRHCSRPGEELNISDEDLYARTAENNVEAIKLVRDQKTSQASVKEVADLTQQLQRTQLTLKTTKEENESLCEQSKQKELELANLKDSLPRLPDLEAAKQSRVQASSKLEQELAKVQQEKSALEVSNLVLHSETQDSRKELVDKKKIIHDYTQSFSARKQEVKLAAELKQEVLALGGKIKFKDEKISSLEGVIEAKDYQVSGLQQQLKIVLDDKAQEISDAKLESQAKIMEFSTEKDRFQREISRMQDLKTAKDRTIAEKEEVMEQTRQENVELKKKMLRLETIDAELRKRVEMQDTCLKSQRVIIDRHEALKDQVSALENDKIVLRAEVKDAKDSTSTGKDRIQSLCGILGKEQTVSLALKEEKSALQGLLKQAIDSESCMKQQSGDLSKKFEELQHQFTCLEKDKSTLQIELEKATQYASDWKENSERLSKTIARNEADMNSKKIELDDNFKMIKTLSRDKATLTNQNSSLNKDLEQKDQALVEAQTDNTQIQKARTDTAIQLQDIKTQHSELKITSEKLGVSLSQSQTENEQLQEANQKLQRTLVRMRNEKTKVIEANDGLIAELRKARLRLESHQQVIANPYEEHASVKSNTYDGEADAELSDPETEIPKSQKDAETVISKSQTDAHNTATEVSNEEGVVKEEVESSALHNAEFNADVDSKTDRFNDEKFVLKSAADDKDTTISNVVEEVLAEEVDIAVDDDEDEPRSDVQNILSQCTEPCKDPASDTPSVNDVDSAIQQQHGLDALFTDDIEEKPRACFVIPSEVHVPQPPKVLVARLLPANAADPAIRRQEWRDFILSYNVVERKPKVLFGFQVFETESGMRKYKKDYQQPHSIQNARRRAWTASQDLVYVSDPPYKHPSRPWWTVPDGSFVQSDEDDKIQEQKATTPEPSLPAILPKRMVADQAPQEPTATLNGQEDTGPQSKPLAPRQYSDYNKVWAAPTDATPRGSISQRELALATTAMNPPKDEKRIYESKFATPADDPTPDDYQKGIDNVASAAPVKITTAPTANFETRAATTSTNIKKGVVDSIYATRTPSSASSVKAAAAPVDDKNGVSASRWATPTPSRTTGPEAPAAATTGKVVSDSRWATSTTSNTNEVEAAATAAKGKGVSDSSWATPTPPSTIVSGAAAPVMQDKNSVSDSKWAIPKTPSTTGSGAATAIAAVAQDKNGVAASKWAAATPSSTPQVGDAATAAKDKKGVSDSKWATSTASNTSGDGGATAKVGKDKKSVSDSKWAA